MELKTYQILLILGGVILFLIIEYCVTYNILDAFEKKDPDKLYITFDRFIALYSIAPQKWRLHPNWVGYLLDGPKTREGWATVNETSLYMLPKEWKKYDKWLSEKKRTEQAKKQNEKEAKIIQHWQEDIDRFRNATK